MVVYQYKPAFRISQSKLTLLLSKYNMQVTVNTYTVHPAHEEKLQGVVKVW